MMTRADKVRAIQNLGLIDRIVRGVIGGTMLIVAVLGWETRESWVPAAAMAGLTLGSLYPVFTTMFGWDPLYALFNVRSCRDSGRHACGSFWYQVRAFFGRAPQYCDSDVERSLESCHTEPVERPRHAVWRIDHKTKDYPTAEQLRERGEGPAGADTRIDAPAPGSRRRA